MYEVIEDHCVRKLSQGPILSGIQEIQVLRTEKYTLWLIPPVIKKCTHTRNSKVQIIHVCWNENSFLLHFLIENLWIISLKFHFSPILWATVLLVL